MHSTVTAIKFQQTLETEKNKLLDRNNKIAEIIKRNIFFKNGLLQIYQAYKNK